MSTIKTGTVLMTIDGEPYKQGEVDLTTGKYISAVLATVKSGDPLKSYLLAQRFNKEEEISLTPEEVVFVQGQLKQSEYVPYLIGQVLEALDK